MQVTIITSNCLIESIKHRIKRRGGKLGYGIKKENGHLYFFYEEKGKRYRFYRKVFVHQRNSNRIWFRGYVTIETKENTDFKKYLL